MYKPGVLLWAAVLVVCGNLGDGLPPNYWGNGPPDNHAPNERPPDWGDAQDMAPPNDPGHHFFFYGCKLVNKTSNTELFKKPCGCPWMERENSTCDVGPLDFPGNCGETLSMTFCQVTPDWKSKKPWRGVLSQACQIKEKGGSTVYKTDTCPGNKPCTLGPLSVKVNNTDAEAFFCQIKLTGQDKKCRSDSPGDPMPLADDCVCLSCHDMFDVSHDVPIPGGVGIPGDRVDGPEPPSAPDPGDPVPDNKMPISLPDDLPQYHQGDDHWWNQQGGGGGGGGGPPSP